MLYCQLKTTTGYLHLHLYLHIPMPLEANLKRQPGTIRVVISVLAIIWMVDASEDRWTSASAIL